MSHNLPRYSALIYIASFLFPFFGLIYGLIQSAKPERAYKRMGKWCIALGLISVVAICVGSIVWMGVNIYGGFGTFL
ncbi:MAG: hypothetical protein GY771_04560 [bacterium]|nr:hypothetical protein [bacterium]